MNPLRFLAALLLTTASLHAQAPATPPPVPTTHILAIGHLTVTRDKILPIMQQEVRDTVRLYLAGKIENWYFRTDGKGVVFIINATTVEEAHALLEKLPLGQAHAMEFDLIPLGPLSPLNILLAEKPGAAPGSRQMTCLCATTRRAARNLTRLYEDHLGPTGLTPPQFHLLSLLTSRPALSQQAIAEILDLDQTTLSRNLRILIAEKWVQRRPSPTDARQAIYNITTQGLRTQQAALPHWQQAQHQMQQTLGADWQTAFSILERLSAVASSQR